MARCRIHVRMGRRPTGTPRCASRSCSNRLPASGYFRYNSSSWRIRFNAATLNGRGLEYKLQRLTLSRRACFVRDNLSPGSIMFFRTRDPPS